MNSLGGTGSGCRRSHLRWILLVVILFTEATVLTNRYDVGAIGTIDAGWARLLLATRILMPCGIAVAAGLTLFGRELIASVVERFGSAAPRAWSALLVIHLLSLAWFFRATHFLFVEPPSDPFTGWLFVTAWVASGLLFVASLVSLALPWGAWRYLFSHGAGTLCAGGVVGVGAWIAGQQAEESLWGTLSAPTLGAVRWLISVASSTALTDPGPFMAGTEQFNVQIGIGCSGYEGIGIVWMFLSVYLWASRDKLRFPHALWLLPLGTLLVYAANVVRIFALIMIGDLWSSEIAIGAFHTRAGWALLCVISIALVAWAERSPAFTNGSHCVEIDSGSRRDGIVFVAPLLLLLTAQLIGGSFVADPNDIYPLAVGLAGGALIAFHSDYELRWSWSWPAVWVGALVFVIWVALDREGGTAGSARPIASAAGSAIAPARIDAPTLTKLLSTVLIVPIAEEIAFRGYLLRRLITAHFQDIRIGTFTLYSCVSSSLLFGLAHDRWFVGSIAGLAYALVLYRGKNLTHSIIAHGVTNGLLVVWAFAG